MFIQGPSLNTRLALFVLISFSLMTVDHRYDHLERFRSALSLVVYPLQRLIHLPVSIGHWLDETLTSRETLLEDNASLHKQMLLLKSQLQQYETLERENLRLRELLDSSLKMGKRLLIAELLAVDLDPYKHQITLNKGSSSSVYPGQPLIDAAGIMGQTIHVGPLSATAMLITDLSHALPVQFNRNGIRTIAVGTGNRNQLQLPYLTNDADVQVGDLLITSGLGGRFPAGYPVGTVTTVTPDPTAPYAKIKVKTSAQLGRGREVLLIWPGESYLTELSTQPVTQPTGKTDP